MKSVLISIKPKWCELIASGRKTVEVRKTKPKLETPFKVYIYMTMGKTPKFVYNENLEKQSIYDREPNTANGRVIGEFVCDNIHTTSWFVTPDHPMWQDGFNEEMCLTDRELFEYSKGDIFYEWHISDLVIYDKPRELGEFYLYCGDNPKCDGCEAHYFSNTECGKEDYCCSIIDGCKPLKRPFQSWGYVEVQE